MNIQQYQLVTNLISGSTTYEAKIAQIFNIKTDKDITKVRTELEKLLEVKEYKLGKSVKFMGKTWKWETDLLDSTFEQWSRLDQLLSEEDNIRNLHKLLAIYFRPCNFWGRIEPYNLQSQDKIYEMLLQLDMGIATALMVFFYQNVILSLKFINITYLKEKMNQKKMEKMMKKKEKLKRVE